MNTSTVFVGVGSNIDPYSNITQGFRLLTESGCIDPSSLKQINLSSHYRTPPLKGRSDPYFINGVWQFESQLDVSGTREILKDIETRCGRKASADAYGPRTLDLDLLLYGDIFDPENNLPHPDIYSRPFVYLPILELSPNIVLPGDRKKLRRIVDISPRLVVESSITEALYDIQMTGAMQ